MKEFAVGFALIWVFVTIFKRGSYTIEGPLGFLLAGVISYGLGYIALHTVVVH